MSVTLIATGGTIASTRGADGRVTTTLSGADLLATAGDLPVRVDVVDLSVPGSWNMTTEHAASVALAARDALAAGSTGVVITHGTDVLEETAWLCELLARGGTATGPVVLTCAMRHASEFAGDGPRNLADAIAVAADPDSTGRGALVCANGELHHARWVTKTRATALSTFASPGRGPVGEVTERGVRFTAPSPPPAPPVDGARVEGNVPVVTSHWDVDAGIIDWHLERGARGIVVQGGGAGNVNGVLTEGIERAVASGVPVVGTTRCIEGEVTPIYGGSGGFASLAALGVLPSWGLTTGKARLALGVALGADPDPVAVRDYLRALEVRA
jgi:L-asparaginase